MSDDITNDPDFKAYAAQVHEELVPMMTDSAMCLSMVPDGPTDVKFAIELGFMIMMDKPILAVVKPGTQVPDKLVRVADEIVECDYTQRSMQRLQEQIIAFQEKHCP